MQRKRSIKIKSSYIYKAYGLIFKSEFVISELKEASGVHDVEISIGENPQHLENPEECNNTFEATKDEFLFRIKNVASFYVYAGKKIVVQPIGLNSDKDIRIYLLGSVFGALLHQRGYLVIHGSSIEINGKGVIFTGRSGVGKSTLAAAFHAKGYRVLTDDVIAIEINKEGKPYIIPGFPNIKLWQDAAEKLQKDITNLETICNNMNKYRVAAPENYLDHPLELKHIYILNPSDESEIKTTKIENINKLEALIANTYRLMFLKGQGGSQTHFKQCVAVCKKVEISKVIRPQNSYMLNELVQYLIQELSDE